MSITAAATTFAFLTKVNWKNFFKKVGVVIACVVAVYLAYKIFMIPYEMGMKAQKEQDQVLIEDLGTKLGKSQKDLKEYKTSYDKWVAEGRVAENTMIQEYLTAMAKVRDQLTVSEQTIAQKQELINEISNRIPDQADGTCLDLSGFVSLYNDSLEAGTSKANPVVPGTGRKNVAGAARSQAAAPR